MTSELRSIQINSERKLTGLAAQIAAIESRIGGLRAAREHRIAMAGRYVTRRRAQGLTAVVPSCDDIDQAIGRAEQEIEELRAAQSQYAQTAASNLERAKRKDAALIEITDLAMEQHALISRFRELQREIDTKAKAAGATVNPALYAIDTQIGTWLMGVQEVVMARGTRLLQSMS